MQALHENGTTEFKREWSESIRKTVLAFANTDGGTLWIGVDDDGRALGVEDPDALALRVGNFVRDAVRPDLSLFVQCEREECDGQTVLRVEVQRGTDRPYYLKAAGLRPEGVFVRQGPASVPASETRIRDLLREGAAERFEEGRSFRQDLSFQALADAFAKRGVAFGAPQEKTLGLRRPDGLFTNLGWILSDQFRPVIKLAAFRGAEKGVFRDRREPEGALVSQLDASLEFLLKWNDVRSEIHGFTREDYWDYDPDDVREALLNAFVHRDYSRPDATLASVFSDRIEIVSIGGIVPGYEPADLLQGGVSALRNPGLANVFLRLGYIEAFGTGIPSIRRRYAGFDPGPEFAFFPHAFRLVLPSRNAARDAAAAAATAQSPSVEGGLLFGEDGPAHLARRPAVRPRGAAIPATPREAAILAAIRRAGTATRESVQAQLGVSLATATRDLKALLLAGRIVKSGAGRNTAYRLP